jgi:TRAP-type C4-dicarboxylate transport system permease small subunit
VGIVVPLAVLIGVVVTTTLASRRWGRVLPAVATGRLRVAARTTRRWRVAGFVVGVAVAAVTAQQGALGRGLLLAGPLCALCVLAGVVVGELRVTAPQGAVRSADLQVRGVRDYLPRRLAGAVGATTALLLVVLSLTSATGSADDLGRAGRSFARRCSAVQGGSTGPWPGSFYALPLAAVVVTGLLLATFALRRVVQRPRQGEDPAVDDGLRRQAAEAVTAACGLLVAVPLAGVSLVTAGALHNHVCPPAGSAAVVVALLVLVPVLVVLAAWCVGVLVAPAGSGRSAHAPVTTAR